MPVLLEDDADPLAQRPRPMGGVVAEHLHDAVAALTGSPRGSRRSSVLPAPLGPSRPNTSPRSTLNEIPRTASTAPYALRRSRTSIAGSLVTHPSWQHRVDGQRAAGRSRHRHRDQHDAPARRRALPGGPARAGRAARLHARGARSGARRGDRGRQALRAGRRRRLAGAAGARAGRAAHDRAWPRRRSAPRPTARSSSPRCATPTGLQLRVLDADAEARLAFAGATGMCAEALSGSVAVIDLGGGSTEIAVGSPAAGVSWWRSVPVGSGTLCDAHLRGDPPSAGRAAGAERARRRRLRRPAARRRSRGRWPWAAAPRRCGACAARRWTPARCRGR